MKKILVGASAALVLSATAYAGGNDTSFDKPYVSPDTDLYVQLQFGVRRHDYKNKQWSSYTRKTSIGDWHGGGQSLAYGADVGYEFSLSLIHI